MIIVWQVLKQQGAAVQEKWEYKFSAKESFGKKLRISTNSWQIKKLLH